MTNPILATKGRGRPRSFDTAEAVQKAATLFWEQGYEGSSIEDLTAAMGITTQSLYAAFGSKAELYRRALAWYQQEAGTSARRSLADERDVFEAIKQSLYELAKEFTRADRPRGCMRSTALIRCAVQHQELAAHAVSLRAETVQAIKVRIDRGVADGQLKRETNTQELAKFIGAVIVGMSVAAQDGSTTAELVPFAELTRDALNQWKAPV